MLFNVLLMIFGFGLVIAIHELGHFLAAKWAGVRVHAFAIGFGRAIVSWRKGMGFRAGSSEEAYKKLIAREREGFNPADPHRISPTEYRINWFPFGGYVKMLGQEDIDPAATSTAPDSYTQKPVWKRMVIISAGVVMNIILAGALFMAVFMVGGLYKPAPVIGGVAGGSPAQKAGLMAGDVVRTIDGEPAEVFEDLMIASALGRRGVPVSLGIERDGEPMTIEAMPAKDEMFGGLQGLGVVPGLSNRLLGWDKDKEHRDIQRVRMDRNGLAGVEPGMRAVAVNGEAIDEVSFALRSTIGLYEPIERAAERSDGAPVSLTFAGGDGAGAQGVFTPQPDLQRSAAMLGGERRTFDHLLGLTPVMRVLETQDRGYDQGLRAGDVFARIGDLAWPGIVQGMERIQSTPGAELDVVVVRDGAFVPLTVRVARDGRIGFLAANELATAVLARTPETVGESDDDPAPVLAASRLTPGIMPGLVVTAIGGEPVTDWRTMRAALLDATAGAYEEAHGTTIKVSMALMGADEPAPQGGASEQSWELTAADVRALHGLGWNSGEVASLFQPAQINMHATGPAQALAMGVRSTKRVLAMTYITFLRLFEGTVKVSHLKGPVGITQIGSQMASQGFVYLLYFLALVSANLAVVNFLPIPIADGGHFVMLLYEGITKRPVPVSVQNALTMAGLILIGAVFLIVTLNDIRGLF